MATMSLHYWAGARAAAGVAEEQFEADSVADALESACQSRGEAFRRVVGACSLLVDGIAAHPADLQRPRTDPVRVELLPPFAGGSGAGRAPRANQVYLRCMTKPMLQRLLRFASSVGRVRTALSVQVRSGLSLLRVWV